MKTAMEISAKLEDSENKIFQIEDRIKKIKYENDDLSDYQKSTADENSILFSTLERNLRDAYLSYMNIWEFFSFLVNNNEINNPNIIKYFKDNLKSGSDSFFNKYPEHKSKGDSMKEVKELKKSWRIKPFR